MPRHQGRQVEIDDLPAGDPPRAADHYAVGAMGAAKDEGGKRVARPRKARLVQLEQGQIGLLAGRDPSDVVAPEARRRAGGRPVQHVQVPDPGGAVAQALYLQRLPHLLHQVRGILGRRAVDAHSDRRSGRNQVDGRTKTRGEHHVGARTVANARTGPSQSFDLLRGEMDAMGEPDPVGEPTRGFEIVERAAPEPPFAERVLVLGLPEMGMKTNPLVLGEPRRVAHDLSRHRERRARCERDLNEGALPRLVKGVDHPFAVREDGFGVLDDGYGRQAAVLDREIHGAARQRHAHAQIPGGRSLYVDRVLESLRIHVVVVRRRRAAGEQQLGEGEPRRRVEMVRSQPRPHGVEGLEPVEELLVEGGAVGTGQGLVEMVMRIDEAGQHDVLRGVEDPVAGRAGRGPGGQALGDAIAVHDQAARRRLVGQDGERIPYPGPHPTTPLTAHSQE